MAELETADRKKLDKRQFAYVDESRQARLDLR
jgi:hypothetical protein